MTKQTSEVIVFNGGNLKALLQRVGLKGAIDECVLEIVNGAGKVMALDMSNVVLVNAEQELTANKDNLTLGLGKLGLLVGFLEGEDGIHAEITGEGTWLTLAKPNNSKLKVQLLAKDTVATTPKGDIAEIKENILKTAKITIRLEKEKVDELIKYIGLIGCASVIFTFNDTTGNLTVNNNPDSEQQFIFELTHTEGIIGGNISVEVYSQFLLLVLKTLIWSANEIPIISLGDKTPVILSQNENNFWALTPIMQ